MNAVTEALRPGIYSMAAELYHADPAPQPSLSASMIKTMLNQSPLHAWCQHPRLNPDIESDNDPKFDLGTAAHSLVLEGIDNMLVVDADDWRTKAAKQAREDAYAAGRTPVLAQNHKHLTRMLEVAQDAVRNCVGLSGFTFEQGQPEQTLIWQEQGIWCRSRLDMLANDYHLILDYKTTTGSASPDKAARQILDQLNGDIQAAMNLRGLRHLTGKDAKFIFMVQELDPPFSVSFIGVGPAYLTLGEDKILSAMATWRECMKSGRWPAYTNQICWAAPKPWEIDRWVEKSDQRGDYNEEYGEQA